MSSADEPGPPTDASVLLLLATRLRSRGDAAAVAEMFLRLGGDETFDVSSALDAAETAGLVRSRGDVLRRSLTAAGEIELAAALAVESAAAGRAEIEAAYEAFLPLNRELLRVLAGSVSTGRRSLLLAASVGRLDPILDALRERLRRFDGYRARFRHALAQAETDPRWFDAPGLDSVHTIWFELHEHLLATLGRTRIGEP